MHEIKRGDLVKDPRVLSGKLITTYELYPYFTTEDMPPVLRQTQEAVGTAYLNPSYQWLAEAVRVNPHIDNPIKPSLHYILHLAPQKDNQTPAYDDYDNIFRNQMTLFPDLVHESHQDGYRRSHTPYGRSLPENITNLFPNKQFLVTEVSFSSFAFFIPDEKHKTVDLDKTRLLVEVGLLDRAKSIEKDKLERQQKVLTDRPRLLAQQASIQRQLATLSEKSVQAKNQADDDFINEVRQVASLEDYLSPQLQLFSGR